MKNLNSYGVVEMTQDEMIMVEGGSWLSKAIKAVGEVLADVLVVVELAKKIWDLLT